MIDFDHLPRFRKFQVTILGMIGEWASTYKVPDDMIEKQILEAHAWVLSNPKKAPRERILRFLNSWMAAAERYHNLRRKAFLPPPPAAPPAYDMSVSEMIAIRKKNMGQKFS